MSLANNLLTVEQYCSKEKISDRAFRLRRVNPKFNLELAYVNGKRYVIDTEDIQQIKTDPKVLKVLISGIAAKFNDKIKEAALKPEKKPEIVAEIVKEAEQWELKGVTVRGYSSGKVYEKIRAIEAHDFEKNPHSNPLQRKQRYDKFSRFYNPILQKEESRNNLLMIAAHFYFKNSNGSKRDTAIKVIEYAKTQEKFIELGALSLSTVRDFIDKQFDALSMERKHQHMMRYNQFRQMQNYNQGAFTDDINFMEYWCIDDKVEEISGAQVYNNVTGKLENKKVYSWRIIDAFTLDIIAYAKKHEPFKAIEIKKLLIEALMSRGRPSKGILMDNGLAASAVCIEMLTQLKIPYYTGGAYEPLHKAVIERAGRFEKDEFNVIWKNYIGGKRSEVRHSGKKLSPEAPDYTFEEYQQQYDNYIKGWYRNKPRERVIKRKRRTISIKDHFEECYMNYQCKMIPRRELAFAAKEYKIRTMRHYYINMGAGLGIYDKGANDIIPHGYNDRKYICYYNPFDTNYVDCYAAESFRNEDEEVSKHQYLFTLKAQYAKGTEERQRDVAASRKTYEKRMREGARAVTNNVLTENIEAIPAELNEQGKYIDHREELNKYSRNLMEEKMSEVSEAVKEKLQSIEKKRVTASLPDAPQELEGEDLLEFYENQE